jgi:hypothetical protein
VRAVFRHVTGIFSLPVSLHLSLPLSLPGMCEGRNEKTTVPRWRRGCSARRQLQPGRPTKKSVTLAFGKPNFQNAGLLDFWLEVPLKKRAAQHKLLWLRSLRNRKFQFFLKTGRGLPSGLLARSSIFAKYFSTLSENPSSHCPECVKPRRAWVTEMRPTLTSLSPDEDGFHACTINCLHWIAFLPDF